jgi:DNA processing protein
MTRKLVAGLAAFGFTIVSGLASGVDAAAHKAAIDSGAKTIAFLGCGVERAYPADNRKLMDEVIKHGAVYSEYMPGTIPHQQNFPQRNRLISGTSLGIIVAEAGERSGALITAGFAGEHGRDVFAVPGNATSPLSRGTNDLIRDGALIAASAEDVIFALNKYMAPDMQGFGCADEVRRMKTERGIEALDGAESNIVKLLRDRGPQDIDAIAAQCALPAGEAGSLAVMLEVRGLLRRMDDGAYEFAD